MDMYKLYKAGGAHELSIMSYSTDYNGTKEHTHERRGAHATAAQKKGALPYSLCRVEAVLNDGLLWLTR